MITILAILGVMFSALGLMSLSFYFGLRLGAVAGRDLLIQTMINMPDKEYREIIEAFASKRMTSNPPVTSLNN